MHLYKTSKNNSGFTIVELLVTIVVGVLFTIALGLIVSTHTHISQQNLDLATANSFAEQKIEELRSKGFLSLNTGSTNITNELPSQLASPRSGTLVISDQSTGLKKIELAITYNDQGKAKTYQYSTYVGELGVGQY